MDAILEPLKNIEMRSKSTDIFPKVFRGTNPIFNTNNQNSNAARKQIPQIKIRNGI